MRHSSKRRFWTRLGIAGLCAIGIFGGALTTSCGAKSSAADDTNLGEDTRGESPASDDGSTNLSDDEPMSSGMAPVGVASATRPTNSAPSMASEPMATVNTPSGGSPTPTTATATGVPSVGGSASEMSPPSTSRSPRCSGFEPDGSFTVPRETWGELFNDVCVPVTPPSEALPTSALIRSRASSVIRTESEPLIPQEPPSPPSRCGDGALHDDELCDDGNLTSGDGCSSDCSCIEDGYSCVAGFLCEYVGFCGDSRVREPEECDDGNAMGGDGCSEHCQIEANHACHTPGEPCLHIAACGNTQLDRYEECDDGNTVGGDGCGADCKLEGITCAELSSLNAGTTADAGADAAAPTALDVPCAPQTAAPTCGDGVLDVRLGEQCDWGADVNLGEYGGCNPDCTFASRCGDGILHCELEQCDDGNISANDGCQLGCVFTRQLLIR